MQDFVSLCRVLDESIEASDKYSALENYFAQAKESDKLWAISLLKKQRPKRIADIGLLKRCVLELTNLPEWLLEESYAEVGDMTEVVSLILPDNTKPNGKSLAQWLDSIHRMRNQSEDILSVFICESWAQLSREERCVFNKLITGRFRSTVSEKSLHKALSKILNMEESLVAYKLDSHWNPQESHFNQVFYQPEEENDFVKPLPFKPFHLVEEPILVPSIENYHVEWKWEGIRAQIIVSNSRVFIWTEDKELVNAQLSEFDGLKEYPNSFALEGEIIIFNESEDVSLSDLRKRISRKNQSKKLVEELPVIFIAKDLLKWEELDLRQLALIKRKEKLNELIKIISSQYCEAVLSSDEIDIKNIQELESTLTTKRKAQTIGVLLKHKLSRYVNSEDKKDWLFLKYKPSTALVVMMYVQKIQLITDSYSEFSFGVWDTNQQLVPIAKVEPDLSDEDISQIDDFIKNNILEKFGPVRAIKQSLVFEISFEGIVKSKRHKSGIELKNPKITAWMNELQASEADRLSDLRLHLV